MDEEEAREVAIAVNLIVVEAHSAQALSRGAEKLDGEGIPPAIPDLQLEVLSIAGTDFPPQVDIAAPWHRPLGMDPLMVEIPRGEDHGAVRCVL
jgi:hypothetical protein